jgi:hypothetical protein
MSDPIIEPDFEPELSAEQLRRERDHAAKLAAGRKARDIGAIPDTIDVERRLACASDFKLACETYFSEKFSLAWSNDHLRVITKIESVLLRGGLFAFGMPRGTGKSTLAIAACVFALLYGLHPYLVLIAATTKQAEKLLKTIQRVLTTSPLIIEDFPEAVVPMLHLENNARRQIGQLCQDQPTHMTWSSDQLVFPTITGEQLPQSLRDLGMTTSPSSGAAISIAGLDSAMRGFQHTLVDGRVIRPSLFIADDPQTRKSAASLVQTRARIDTIYGDVLGMAGPGKKMSGFVPCTKIYTDDLADQLLDPERAPEFKGECTKMIYRFPSNEKLWEQYAEAYLEGLRNDDGGAAANAFYERQREAMDEGAEVAWPERYDQDELSAIQHAMNHKLRNEEAFFAEFQNEPMTDAGESIAVSVEDVVAKANGRPRGEVPGYATIVTSFIDVQERALYHGSVAWGPDFTGHVLDYGAFPDQGVAYHLYRKLRKSLRRKFPGRGVEGAVLAGLLELGRSLLDREWPVAGVGRGGSQTLRTDLMLIDCGHLPRVVGEACRQLGANAMPAKGVGIKASNKPMSSYRRKPGERHGHHWYIPAVAKTAEVRHVLADTNWWKTETHRGLGTADGDPGSLTLFGKAGQHRMIAEHVAAAESCTQTEGHGRSLYEWVAKPAKPDNHLFDVLVGCRVAASMRGVGSETQRVATPKRKRVKLSELQAKRRAA